MSRLMILLAACFALHSTLCRAQPPAKIADTVKASIGDVAWIAGTWRGEALGGKVEEVWSPPLGDNMMGMFKLVKEGKTNFYELLTIVEHEGSLLLRIKHFDRQFKGWEEKDQSEEFPLTSLEPRKATFSGLSFQLEDQEHLTIKVQVENDGQANELVFRFSRMKMKSAGVPPQ